METPIDYRLLSIFKAVAEETSFSKAAAKLAIAKGTVSRAIARLEASVGAELIHRTTHTVALSTAGAALYERTARHLAALDEAMVELPERAEQPSGLLRLTAPRDFGAIVLPELLPHFSRRYPDVDFDLRITNANLDLVGEGLDVAIRASVMPMKDSTLTVRRLGPVASGIYAAPSYLARRGKPKKLADPEHEWVLHPGLARSWKVPRERSVHILCDDFLVIRDLIRDGAGIGMLPAFVGNPYVRDGLLDTVHVPSRVLTMATFVVLYPSSGTVPRKVSAFRDFLIDWLAKSPLE